MPPKEPAGVVTIVRNATFAPAPVPELCAKGSGRTARRRGSASVDSLSPAPGMPCGFRSRFTCRPNAERQDVGGLAAVIRDLNGSALAGGLLASPYSVGAKS